MRRQQVWLWPVRLGVSVLVVAAAGLVGAGVASADKVRVHLTAAGRVEQLGRLLVAVLQTETRRNGELVHHLNPRWLERYVDRAQLADDVRRLQPSATGSATVAVHQFLTELEMLNRGEDPDWPGRGR